MKVEIRVWYEIYGKMHFDTILEQEGNLEVVEHGVYIERCQMRNDTLVIYLDEYPECIDFDPRFNELALFNKESACDLPWTLLYSDKGNVVRVYQYGEREIATINEIGMEV